MRVDTSLLQGITAANTDPSCVANGVAREATYAQRVGTSPLAGSRLPCAYTIPS